MISFEKRKKGAKGVVNNTPRESAQSDICLNLVITIYIPPLMMTSFTDKFKSSLNDYEQSRQRTFLEKVNISLQVNKVVFQYLNFY